MKIYWYWTLSYILKLEKLSVGYLVLSSIYDPAHHHPAGSIDSFNEEYIHPKLSYETLKFIFERLS